MSEERDIRASLLDAILERNGKYLEAEQLNTLTPEKIGAKDQHAWCETLAVATRFLTRKRYGVHEPTATAAQGLMQEPLSASQQYLQSLIIYRPRRYVSLKTAGLLLAGVGAGAICATLYTMRPWQSENRR